MNAQKKKPPEQRLIEILRDLNKPLTPESTGIEKKLVQLDGIRAVLFDVYGTMFISECGDIGTLANHARIQALIETLSVIGFSGQLHKAAEKGAQLFKYHVERVHKNMKKGGVEYPDVEIRQIWYRVLNDLYDQKLIQPRPKRKDIPFFAVHFECRVNPVWPMPGLEVLLNQLRKKKMVLGIVSNAQFFTPLLFNALCDKTPAKLGFLSPLCAYSYQFMEAKPSIDLFYHVLYRLREKYGISEQEILYIGNDMLNDIWPAASLGFRTALFAGDKRSLRLRSDDARVRNTVVDAVLTELRQLNEVV